MCRGKNSNENIDTMMMIETAKTIAVITKDLWLGCLVTELQTRFQINCGHPFTSGIELSVLFDKVSKVNFQVTETEAAYVDSEMK